MPTPVTYTASDGGDDVLDGGSEHFCNYAK